MDGNLRLVATGAALCLAVLSPLAAQRGSKKPEKWRIDPYTKNDPKAMERVGYVAFAPFDFGEYAGKPVSTDAIEETLGKLKIRWVETEHFKLGSSLPSFTIPASDRPLKAKLRGELERLGKRLPRINIKTRRLDPWLRVHLFAQRLEDLYEDFARRLDVTAASFPTQRNAQLRNGKYWGEGPYLGQHGKYAVLLFQKGSDFTRYLSLFVGKVQEMAQRWNFKIVGSQLFATAEELIPQGSYDTRMHTHVVFNVVHNLINGYRFYSYDLPVWFNEGMAHWYSIRVSKKWGGKDFDQNESASVDMINSSKWAVKTRQWLVAGKLRPAAELLILRDFGQLTKYDHVKSWSLCDYLMSLGDEKWRDYMNEVKGFIDPVSREAVAREVLKLQRKGLRKAYDLNPLNLDEKWKQWVMETYPVK